MFENSKVSNWIRSQSNWLSIYAIATLMYALGWWYHYPYGGGHVYSDLIAVFQNRECLGGPCTFPLPYLQGFVEYPIITAYFMWGMGIIASHSGSVAALLYNYYNLSVLILALPTFLTIREIKKILVLLGVAPERRTLLYFIVTPTFVFMLLLNWYIIGTFFAFFGFRKFLEGDLRFATILLGLSAASNLVTAIPALGIIYMLKSFRQKMVFAIGVASVYFLINLPFIVLNFKMWFSIWTYDESWYTEGSWFNVFFTNVDPARHILFPLVLVTSLIAIILVSLRDKSEFKTKAIRVTWMVSFAYFFSTYIFTPQINVFLLPFFAIAPIATYYWEFLAFDIVNSLVILLGFSQALLVPFGITYHFDAFGYWTIVQWCANIRSLWVGKFLIWDGLIRGRNRRQLPKIIESKNVAPSLK